jgi:hypothetical protein
MKDVVHPETQANEGVRDRYVNSSRLLLEMEIGSVDVDTTGDEVGIGILRVMRPN